MPANKSLDDLFVSLLKDMYYAEKQILKALPMMAQEGRLRRSAPGLEHHLKETEGQVVRLERVFALCGLKPSGKTCPAIACWSRPWSRNTTPTGSLPIWPKGSLNRQAA